MIFGERQTQQNYGQAGKLTELDEQERSSAKTGCTESLIDSTQALSPCCLFGPAALLRTAANACAGLDEAYRQRFE